MKLVIAVLHTEDADPCTSALMDSGYQCTRIASFGGFLDRGNATLLVGVDDVEVDTVLEILRSNALRRSEALDEPPPVPTSLGVVRPPRTEVETGGATVFVLSAERVEKL